MKRILFILVLICLANTLQAQQPYIYTIKADSVKITNTCDTAELIIENHTQNVPGFLFNKGRGRTEFRRIAQLNDTSVVVGGDTIHLGRGNKNFANADLTLTGNRIHNGANHSMGLSNFSYIDLMTGNYDGNHYAEMLVDSNRGLEVWAYNADNMPVPSRFFVGKTLNFESYPINSAGHGLFHVEPDNFFLASEGSYGTGYIDFNSNENSTKMEFGVMNGNLSFGSGENNANKRIGMDFYKADSFRVVSQIGIHQSATFKQTVDQFLFRNYYGTTDFRLIGLPSSSNTADSMLVVDNNGQVKKRSQSPTRKSATVTGASYTVPTDVDVVFVNYTAGQATITLPTGTLDREITIKNLHTTNTVIISGLDTSESNSVATRGAITVKYTGSAWVGISKY